MAAPAKMQKTEAAAAPAVDEMEVDAKRDPSPKIKDTVAFLTPDTTLNVMPSTVGNLLVAMSEGGLSHLVGGARANVGVKSGRYMFEAKIVEQAGGKNMVRVGFAAEGSLFLGEDDNSICFDNDGFMVSEKKKSKCSLAFARDVMVAVVLNLDEKSANGNTISFFRDGVRASQPQPLPESLKGKTLFPAVSFKNCSVHVNFAAPVVPLPFTCKVIQEASQKEAVVMKYDEPADGKYTALFPIGLPDEGSFDWLESFLEKNPGYTELSDRAFTEWGLKSGLHGSKKKASNDKPDLGLNGLENMTTIKKDLMQVAALQPRNFVVMEVKGNLVKEERLAALSKFKTPVFKTVAEIVVGEPPSSFKRLVHSKTLQAKQTASDKEFKAKHAEEKRVWVVKKKQKEAEKAKKKMEKERKKKAEEAKKKAEEHMKKRKAELEAKKRAAAGQPAEEQKEEEKPEDKAEESEEEPEEPMEPEPEAGEPPKVAALTAEEKAVRFFKHDVADLAPYVMNTTFAKFSLPAADEGFDAVKYSWSKESDAATYLKEYISEKKQTTRVENITPSAWFKQQQGQWNSALSSWKNKQNEYKAMVAKKAADKQARIAKKAATERKAKLEAEKKAKEAEAKKAEGKEEEKEEEKAPMEVEEEEEEPEAELDFDGIDVFGADDILDVGGKVPIFRDFQFEDFAMMSLRFELHLLVHAFGKDCDDEERTGIHLDHLPFYYQKYYGKTLATQSFGVQTLAELVGLVNDTIILSSKSVIESLIPAELDSTAVFVKITEEARRARNLQVDMGVEGAKLKIQKNGDGGQGQKRTWDGQKAEGGKGAWGKGNGGWGNAGGAWKMKGMGKW